MSHGLFKSDNADILINGLIFYRLRCSSSGITFPFCHINYEPKSKYDAIIYMGVDSYAFNVDNVKDILDVIERMFQTYIFTTEISHVFLERLCCDINSVLRNRDFTSAYSYAKKLYFITHPDYILNMSIEQKNEIHIFSILAIAVVYDNNGHYSESYYMKNRAQELCQNTRMLNVELRMTSFFSYGQHLAMNNDASCMNYFSETIRLSNDCGEPLFGFLSALSEAQFACRIGLYDIAINCLKYANQLLCPKTIEEYRFSQQIDKQIILLQDIQTDFMLKKIKEAERGLFTTLYEWIAKIADCYKQNMFIKVVANGIIALLGFPSFEIRELNIKSINKIESLKIY